MSAEQTAISLLRCALSWEKGVRLGAVDEHRLLCLRSNARADRRGVAMTWNLSSTTRPDADDYDGPDCPSCSGEGWLYYLVGPTTERREPCPECSCTCRDEHDTCPLCTREGRDDVPQRDPAAGAFRVEAGPACDGCGLPAIVGCDDDCAARAAAKEGA